MHYYCLRWRPAFPVVACGWSQYRCPSLPQVLLHVMFWVWLFPYAPIDHNGDAHVPACNMAPTSTIAIHCVVAAKDRRLLPSQIVDHETHLVQSVSTAHCWFGCSCVIVLYCHCRPWFAFWCCRCSWPRQWALYSNLMLFCVHTHLRILIYTHITSSCLL